MIDTAFNFGSEPGTDPGSHSPTLRRYHRLLWSKPLPRGAMFDLQEAGRKGSYHLRHSSALGEFKLSSDAITTRLLKRAKRVVAQIPPEQMPHHRGYTIGSALLFPKTALPGRMTINKARGWNARIADRFDRTLECIRRHYAGEDSPLADTLSGYADFFALFEDFAGYIDFWLLPGPRRRRSGALLAAVRRLQVSRRAAGRRVIPVLLTRPGGLHHREEPAH